MKASIQFVPQSQFTPHVRKVLTHLWHEVSLLEAKNIDQANLDIYIVSEEEIQSINKQYRQIDKVTDVVSLDFGVDVMNQKIGVIYIASAVLKRVARQMRHTYTQELVFISLHGMLHVWGHDHEHVEEEKTMLKQKEILLQNFPRYSSLLSTYRSR